MKIHAYTAAEYEQKISAALGRIKTVLDNTRNPQRPADVPHRYDDKYLLAEFVTRMTIASLVQCLEVIGLTPEALGQLQGWAESRSVTLRLSAEESCRFVREETHKVESAEQKVVETRGLLGTKTRTEKVVTTVTESLWSFEFAYRIVAYQGNVPDKPVTLVARSGHIELRTGAKVTPQPEALVRPPIDVNVTWLVSHLDGDARPAFHIDRTAKSCHTPRRNGEIDAATTELTAFAEWCAKAYSYLYQDLFQVQLRGELPAARNRLANLFIDVFVPVVPLFEGEHLGQVPDGEQLLPLSYANAFLEEERRHLAERLRDLAAMFPSDSSIVTSVEAGLIATLSHMMQVCMCFGGAVQYVEEMLRKQLIAAIGKVLTPADFNQYMQVHHRRLVKAEFRPKPFSYAVRRPDHDPEGVLALEGTYGPEMSEPVMTTVAASEAERPMSFALDASTRVSFLGDRFLHAWISHQFSGASALALQLAARARQFSSFILLVGRIASADTFEPRYGIILQNKDWLKIPILLEQIPTPKEFRDAIESLSPEQQRFAKAFRGMQLESTLFGVCVIQIKPQLEKLMKLPPDSLTKEIKLTQDLLNLFIEYQIPSDLLSSDAPADAPVDAKLALVKEYVARMNEMITLSKKREIEEEQEREDLRLAEANRSRRTDPPTGQYAAPASPYPPAPPPFAMMAMPAGMGPPGMGPPPAFGPSGGMAFGGAPPPPHGPPGMAAAPPPRAAPAPAAPPAPAPVPVQAPPPTATKAEPPRRAEGGDGPPDVAGEGIDYTRIPVALDKKFEALDEDGALRATILTAGKTWTRTGQKGLLSNAVETSLGAKQQEAEKQKAFDLLDALTKSGALPIEHASLHVVLAATHCFDKTLLDTVICDNVNPIEKVERSLMIVGTTIHARPAAELLADDQRERFFRTSPLLGPSSER